MGNPKKLIFFQPRRLLPVLARHFALSFLISLLLPTHLLKGENGQLVRRPAVDQEKGNFQLLKIYSVLKPRMELEDSTVWKIARTILDESVKRSIDPLLVLAIIHVESGFHHKAVSDDGGRGLMQINTHTADSLAKRAPVASWRGPKSLEDPIFNIKLGVFYLWNLIKSFKDLKLALTAYNWGPTQVRNRLADEGSVPLDYAKKVLFAYRNFRQKPTSRIIEAPEPEDEPFPVDE